MRENVGGARKRPEGEKGTKGVIDSVKTSKDGSERRKRASLKSSTSQSRNQHHRRNQRRVTRLRMREPSSLLNQLPVVLRTSPLGSETSRQVRRECHLLPALQTTAIGKILTIILPR